MEPTAAAGFSFSVLKLSMRDSSLAAIIDLVYLEGPGAETSLTALFVMCVILRIYSRWTYKKNGSFVSCFYAAFCYCKCVSTLANRVRYLKRNVECRITYQLLSVWSFFIPSACDAYFLQSPQPGEDEATESSPVTYEAESQAWTISLT
jgi:hypothetical protein